MKETPSSEHITKTKVPKWYLAYFFLAAFDILTVSISVFLTHNITGIFFNSVEANKVWAVRQQNLSELRLLANGA